MHCKQTDKFPKGGEVKLQAELWSMLDRSTCTVENTIFDAYKSCSVISQLLVKLYRSVAITS